MSLSKPAVKRKVVDEHRQFQEKWGVQYFFVDHRGNPTCVICTEKVAVHKEYNLKRHYITRHAEEYEKYQGDERANQFASLKTHLLRQQHFFKKANKESSATVEASYIVSEMIAKQESHSQKVNLSKSACYRLHILSAQKRKVSSTTSAFLPTLWQSAFLTCQVISMINCVRKQNVSVYIRWFFMRPQTSQTLRS